MSWVLVGFSLLIFSACLALPGGNGSEKLAIPRVYVPVELVEADPTCPVTPEGEALGCCPGMGKPAPGGRHPGRQGPLSAQEYKMAKIAWKYFENNYQPETGLVNAVDGYPSTTLWDTASYLGGLVAAFELCIVDKEEFDRRIRTITKTFNSWKLFQGEMPNKAYNTKTGEKVDYRNKPGEIGFSALDIGRLLIWLRIIRGRYPHHANGIDNALLRWNWCNIVDPCGSMYGAVLKNDKPLYLQEGRLGYEEYAAKGFNVWGFDTDLASLPDPYETISIYGVDVPYDTRDPRVFGAHNYVVAESYVLDGIEMNWDLPDDRKSDDMRHTNPWIAEFAQRIYKVQEQRYNVDGVLTARTEHQLDGKPYFVYDTIYTDGYPWNTITEKGDYVPEKAAIAVKGAIGLWALFDTPYTDLLFDAICGLYNPEKGFYEGRYEKSGGLIKAYTSNNNGILLETLLYKVQGKLFQEDIAGIWEAAVRDPFTGYSKCIPEHRERCGAINLGK